MQNLIFTLFLLTTSLGWAQVKVSVSDGDWNNPANWSPAVVPFLNEDTVIVNHQMTISTTTEVGINHLIVNGSIAGNFTYILHGSLTVDGSISVDSLATGDGDFLINNGLIETGTLVATNPTNENYGSIVVTATFANVEPFLNAIDGSMDINSLITTSDGDLENNGTIQTIDWLNEGTTFGAGSICIAECFQNVGSIEGTLDVCDSTPNGGVTCDFNFGSIGSTVTECATAACEGTSNLSEVSLDAGITIYPNPLSNGVLHLTSASEIAFVHIYDLSGRTLFSQKCDELNSVDLSLLKPGEYVLTIQTKTHFQTEKLVISE